MGYAIFLGAGLGLVPMATVFFVVSNMARHLAECVGARAMIAGGTALTGTGLWVIGATAAGRPLWLAEAERTLDSCVSCA